MRTLEEYFKSECAKGTLDFALRATLVDGVVSLYIHPAGRHGDTTPTLIVEGDSVRQKFPAPAGGAPLTSFLNGTCPRCGSGWPLTVNSLPPPISATLYPIPLAVTAAHVPTTVPATFVGTTLVGLPAADALGTVEFQHAVCVGNDVVAPAAARAAAIAATENALADTVNALAPSTDGEV
jgi:hypothetical protein